MEATHEVQSQNLSESNSDIQEVEKAKRVTHRYNIMVCGSSGIGKTSFIELFMLHFNKQEAAKILDLRDDMDKTDTLIAFPTNQDVIKDETRWFKPRNIKSLGIKNDFELQLVDTPGYGNKLSIEEWRANVVKELRQRMMEYKKECQEIQIKYMGQDQMISRQIRSIEDHRIHLILYFFENHRAKELDFQTVKDL